MGKNNAHQFQVRIFRASSCLLRLVSFCHQPVNDQIQAALSAWVQKWWQHQVELEATMMDIQCKYKVNLCCLLLKLLRYHGHLLLHHSFMTLLIRKPDPESCTPRPLRDSPRPMCHTGWMSSWLHPNPYSQLLHPNPFLPASQKKWGMKNTIF